MSSGVSINHIILMGRLTDEPEQRWTKSSRPVTTFRLAVDRRANTEITDFIPCVAYGAQAEFSAQWLSKGTLAIVIGQLISHSWTDKNGKIHLDFEVQCDKVQFGETKKQRNTREQEQTQQQLPENAPERSGLKIVAVNTLTGDVLSNAAYDVYTMDGILISQRNSTGTDGGVSIVGLSAGEYLITEVKEPDGFRAVTRSVSVKLEPGINHSVTFPHSEVPAGAPHSSIMVYDEMPEGYDDDDVDSMI